MTDNESLYAEEDEGSPDERRGDNNKRRDRMAIVAAIAVVVFILIVLLMLRGCGSVLNSAESENSGRHIVPVEGRSPVDGSISVWLDPKMDIQRALSAARVAGTEVVDMGEGRFVVIVPMGTEVDATRALRKIDGVYDAGRVYADEATSQP